VISLGHQLRLDSEGVAAAAVATDTRAATATPIATMPNLVITWYERTPERPTVRYILELLLAFNGMAITTLVINTAPTRPESNVGPKAAIVQQEHAVGDLTYSLVVGGDDYHRRRLRRGGRRHWPGLHALVAARPVRSPSLRLSARCNDRRIIRPSLNARGRGWRSSTCEFFCWA